ncbi:MAG: tetratricopeptide repeat protein [Bryobacterales bacterium]|nr:tetratricopeptide repeat protein [Bryobacterales bacterium]
MFLFLLGCLPLAAQSPAGKGYQHFYNLEFDQAIQVFQTAVQANAEDAESHNHLAHAILYREMLRSGALESELVSGANPFLRREKLKPSLADQQRFEQAISKSMELTNAALSRNPKDTDAMYLQGVALGLRGNYNFLVKKAWTDALRDITNSRKLHNKVTDLEPARIDARLVQGLHDYVVGSLPWSYKILGFIIGFRGNKEEGIKTLQLVAREGKLNSTDAKVLLGVVYRRERRPADAIPLIKDLLTRYPRNYLLRLEMVQMYGDLGDKQSALAALRELDELKKANTTGLQAMPAEKINYARGTLLFWYRDYDIAIQELRLAAAKAKDLDLNTSSMTYLRLGQCYDMKQNRNDALAAYRQAIAIAPDSDAARQSRQFLSSPYKRGKA